MMSYADLDQARLELMEKLYRLANLQADTALKQAQEKLNQAQERYEPWKVVISAMAAGGAIAAGLLALYKALGV